MRICRPKTMIRLWPGIALYYAVLAFNLTG
jgi:hypothetical protein